MKKYLTLFLIIPFFLTSCWNLNNKENLDKLWKTIPWAIWNTLWSIFVTDSKKEKKELCESIKDWSSNFSWLEDIDCKVNEDKFIFSFKIIEKWLEEQSEIFKKEYICWDNNFYWIIKSKINLSNIDCNQWRNKTKEDINTLLRQKEEQLKMIEKSMV